MSADELTGAMGGDASKSAATLAKVDADGDGKLTAAELSTAFDAFKSSRQQGRANGGDADVSQTTVIV